MFHAHLVPVLLEVEPHQSMTVLVSQYTPIQNINTAEQLLMMRNVNLFRNVFSR